MLKTKNKLSSDMRQRIFWTIIFAIPIMFITPMFVEHDTWFLLNTGRYIMQNGFPTVEPFTMHQNLAFMIPQWLSAVSFWLIYKYAGSFGLWLLRALMISLYSYISYKLCMLVSNNNLNCSCVLTLISTFVFFKFCTVRPQIYTSTIFLFELYLLENLSLTQKKKYAICLPFVSLLLINCSCAMWPMFFVLALPYIVESFLKSNKFFEANPCPKIPLFTSLAFSFLAGFINPYGFTGMTYLLRSFGQEEINTAVIEMQPPTYRLGLGVLVLIAFVISVYIFVKGTYKPRYFFLTAGTTVLALMSIRNCNIFAIASIFPLAFLLRNYNMDFKIDSNPKNRKMFSFATTIMACLLLTAGLKTTVNFVELDQEEHEPKAAIDCILEDNDPDDVRLYTIMDYGSYAEFRGIKAFADTRMEVLVKENNKQKDFLAEWIELQKGNIHYKKFLEGYDFTHILTFKNEDSTDILYTYLCEDPDYKILYEDEGYCVFIPIE